MAALVPPMRLSLHGMAEEHRVEQLAHWRSHLAFLHHDRGPGRVVMEFASSLVSQVSWRITLGPASAFLPGAGLLLAGLAALLLALTSPIGMISNALVAVSALSLGGVLTRHPRVQPRRALGAAALLGSVTCLYYSVVVARDIWTPSDWFLVIGMAIIGIGLCLVFLSTLPRRMIGVQTGRSWGFGLCAVGTGSIAVAEIDWLLNASDEASLLARGIAAAATLVMAFTCWRIREVPQDPEQGLIITASDGAAT